MKHALMSLMLALPLAVPLTLNLPPAGHAQGYTPPSAAEGDPSRATPDLSPNAPAPMDRNPGRDLGRSLGKGLSGDDFGKALDDQLGSFLDGLANDLQPHMEAIGRDLGARLNTLAPIFDDLGNMVDDIKNYQAPERLANGDILIRRKPGAPPPPPVSEQFQDLTRPAPEMDPRLNPPADRPDRAAPALPKGPQIDL
ncbi:hypothetical protein [Paracoccus aminophilus]|uniref:Uncharacterized protein n=1 Tax=Paracoccus aminophilus JCM 7686 TaxID=1367847 RepID=S5XV42_PARAH|nr:hypothetical protein [Paracoccus aminophilus]AGT09082.1 hypothetical protein JCM7686_1981 [Paracoccus aminophilus JCM 7686]